jgi:hypothetical protein
MSQGDSAPDAIVEQLRSSQSREAWAEFLRRYSPLIFSACQFSTSDGDQAADCFLFACEQLSRNHFSRLLRFRPQGRASFPTWLRVVVRNLCLDGGVNSLDGCDRFVLSLDCRSLKEKSTVAVTSRVSP